MISAWIGDAHSPFHGRGKRTRLSVFGRVSGRGGILRIRETMRSAAAFFHAVAFAPFEATGKASCGQAAGDSGAAPDTVAGAAGKDLSTHAWGSPKTVQGIRPSLGAGKLGDSMRCRGAPAITSQRKRLEMGISRTCGLHESLLRSACGAAGHKKIRRACPTLSLFL